MYNVDHAIAEMERCKKAGIVGTMIWQVPDAKLPFTSDHYERFWAASQDQRNAGPLAYSHRLRRQHESADQLRASIACRIGVKQTREIEDRRCSILCFTGVLDRYPKLKIVSVENEVGWMPFWIGQCDKGFKRHRHCAKSCRSTKLPSEYFYEQIFSTFFNDAVGGKMFSWWGVDNCMWSNDYPHQNSTWPNSRVGYRS